jgi:hypothetical protein
VRLCAYRKDRESERKGAVGDTEDEREETGR